MLLPWPLQLSDKLCRGWGHQTEKHFQHVPVFKFFRWQRTQEQRQSVALRSSPPFDVLLARCSDSFPLAVMFCASLGVVGRGQRSQNYREERGATVLEVKHSTNHKCKVIKSVYHPGLSILILVHIEY